MLCRIIAVSCRNRLQFFSENKEIYRDLRTRIANGLHIVALERSDVGMDHYYTASRAAEDWIPMLKEYDALNYFGCVFTEEFAYFDYVPYYNGTLSCVFSKEDVTNICEK
ncbi:hypothetical protein OESDEN_21880 [Oesophagostomum dentatum]|uniref:Uncharacterized protein n=1 Tax=Oesophagostomum dentatum TaxID=61180 RepID=A0A0B1RZH2_OESDE|nr:hypothetical protein OESDEN_21880 [Oesophagostomum dentatum]